MNLKEEANRRTVPSIGVAVLEGDPINVGRAVRTYHEEPEAWVKSVVPEVLHDNFDIIFVGATEVY